MKRFLITAGLCLVAQASFAEQILRPEPRPALCRVEGGTQLRPCPVVWDVAYRVETPVAKPAVLKARKIVRLPWTIGAFQ
jgi:hypothetical protein